jgi:hypothetical protein
MKNRFIIAWAVVFIAWFIGSYLVHGVLLSGDYMALSMLFRTPADAQRHFPLMILAHVLLAGAFAWIYARGAESKPWAAQGVRFGIAVALLTTVPTYLIYYCVQPMPGEVVAKQIIFDSLLMVILGVIVAAVYGVRAPAAQGRPPA